MTTAVTPVSANAARSWLDTALARVVALAALLTVPAIYQARHLTALADKDVWWRLSTGLWTLQHHAVPQTGLFSQYPSLSWVDLSWGFDLLVGAAYRLFGLAGLPLLLMLLQVAVGVALFGLAFSASGRFWPSTLLAAIAQCCLVPLQPRPALCSIVMLATELALMLNARRASDVRWLYWLPLMFLLWVNLDRQVEYGLLALILFCAGVLLQRSSSALPVGSVAIVAAISFAVTLGLPNTWHTYASLWQSATSPADRYFIELHSMRFRQPQDYLLLLLAMSAFFALGRRRSRDGFLIAMLIVACVISLRVARDNWFVVVVAVAIVSDALNSEAGKAAARRLSLATKLVAACMVLAIVVLTTPRGLSASNLSQKFPVRSADHIRQNGLPQPLFNAYPWGGFLTWYLPEYPVAIDGRTDLYGDDKVIAYFRLIQGETSLQSDPAFTRAQTFLLESDSALAQALVALPEFRVAYRDEQATVIARR
jgi:hypothetical protein